MRPSLNRLLAFCLALSMARLCGAATVRERTGPLIAKHRMGTLTVRTRPGAHVRVTQLRHEFQFGAALNARALVDDAIAEADREAYLGIARTHFNAAVPENSLKWRKTNPDGPAPEYAPADALVDWCVENGLALRGHAVFWGRPMNNPDWVVALSSHELRAALETRGRGVTARYRDRIPEWDLNNEMLRENMYADTLGDGITGEMFAWARDGSPEAALYVNDFNILNSIEMDVEAGGYQFSMRADDLDRYIAQIRSLLADGVPVVGIGVQAHMFASLDIERVEAALSRLGELGLPIKITEFDTPGIMDEGERAEAVDAFYRVCFAHPAVEGIYMWGFWETLHWSPHAALWTSDWKAKPAARAYEDLVLGEWSTTWEGEADSEGVADARAFYGAHLVEAAGQRRVVDLRRRDASTTVVIARYDYTDTEDESEAAALSGIDALIGHILQDPAGKAVLERHIGVDVIADTRFEMAKSVTLSQIAQFMPDILTEQTLAAIDEELKALGLAAPKPVARVYPKLYLDDAALQRRDEGPTLAQVARKAGVHIGADVYEDLDAIDWVAAEFTSITSGPAVKWRMIQKDGKLGEYDFALGDRIVDAALDRGLRVRGHTLIWDTNPLGFYADELLSVIAASSDRPSALRSAMRDHIRAVMGHYAGRIRTWDVVNEPMVGGARGSAENLFYRHLGEGYIADALRFAHEADPEAELLVNEAFGDYHGEKAEAFLDLLRDLLARDVPLHGVGIQSHHINATKDPADLRQFMAKVGALGLLIELTELDAPIHHFADEDDPYAAQGEFYRRWCEAALSVPACRGITVWGLDDSATWYDVLPPRMSTKPNAPLLFDEDRRRKPAYYGVLDALAAAPRSRR